MPVEQFTRDSWQWLPWTILAIAMVLVAGFGIKKRSAFGLGGLIFILTYLPISQLFTPAGDVIAERWMYTPSVGVVIMGVCCFYPLYHKKKILFYILLCILMGIYGVRTYSRNSVWATDHRLFESMTQDAEKSYRGFYLLGKSYVQKGNIPEAKKLYEQSLSILKSPEAYNGLAFLTLSQGREYEAEEFLKQSRALDPYLVATDRLFVQVKFQQRQYADAFIYSKKIIDSNLYRTDDMFFYASILAKLERYEESQVWLLKVLEKDKTNWQPLYLQSVLLYKTGQKDKALQIHWKNGLTVEEKQQQLEAF
jgi:tetratricopeptide (TPR) repeat protein